MPISPSDYNNDAIKGQQLQRLAKNLATEINKKNDKINGEYDQANSMLIFDNVDIDMNPSGNG